jgi:hypothetical protein
MKPRGLKIATTLRLALAALMLMLLVAGTLFWVQSDRMFRYAKGLYEHPMMVSRAVGVMEVDVMAIHHAMKELAKDPDDAALVARARAAGLEFAHTHWVDYRCGRGQRTDRPIAFDNGWSELGEGAGCRHGSAHLAGCGFLCGRARAYRDADCHQESETFRGAREGKSSATVDPRNFDADLHGG